MVEESVGVGVDRLPTITPDSITSFSCSYNSRLAEGIFTMTTCCSFLMQLSQRIVLSVFFSSVILVCKGTFNACNVVLRNSPSFNTLNIFCASFNFEPSIFSVSIVVSDARKPNWYNRVSNGLFVMTGFDAGIIASLNPFIELIFLKAISFDFTARYSGCFDSCSVSNMENLPEVR